MDSWGHMTRLRVRDLITFGLVEGGPGSHVAHQGADIAGDLGAGKGEGRDEEGGENGGGELHFGGWLGLAGGTWSLKLVFEVGDLADDVVEAGMRREERAILYFFVRGQVNHSQVKNRRAGVREASSSMLGARSLDTSTLSSV